MRVSDRGNGEVDTARVEVARNEHIMVVTMVRTAKRNAVDQEMTTALDAAMNELDDDPTVRVGILTGGIDMFCAGTDMAKTSGTPTKRGGVYGLVGRTRVKPLIAAVEGIAFGGGCEIAMACDMVVAASTARFALPEVKRGLVASSGALFRAARVLPLNIAKQMLTTGQDLSAERAYQLGFVNQVTEPGGALAGAMEIAEQLAANAPLAAQHALRVVEHLASASDEEGWDLSADAQRQNMQTNDSREGVQAFFERRAPTWTAS